MKSAIHRDQIHRDVHYDPMSVAIINTPQMQRLGRIYQLGFAHLVYRGGTHTRLSHVLGAAFVAEQLVNTLRKNYETALNTETCPEGAILPALFLPGAKKHKEEDRWDVLLHLVKWGALLHDIGHIPIGHTLEDEFADIYEKHDDFKSLRMPFLWDEIEKGKNSPIKEIFLTQKELYPPSFKSLGITSEDAWRIVMLICLYKSDYKVKSEEEGKFEEMYSKALEKMKQKKLFHRYMAEIVADTICADYLDYVQRDTLNVGFDSMKENRLIQSYYVGEDLTEKDEYRMALSLVDRSGKPKLSVCTAAKNMVRHRFDLAETIYYHKTKVSASAMLAKVFYLIDKPLETGKPRSSINIEDIESHVYNVISESQKDTIQKLKDNCSPDCLLHPFIGDESMLFWLQDSAWKKAESASSSNDEEGLKKALLAISLLESIIERRLYKVAFSIDENFIQIVLNKEPKMVSETVKNILARYRKNEVKGKSHVEREDTEGKMAKRAFYPSGSFIIYVPGAKSQAKGIETGALHKGKVITLGEHSAVKDDVKALNDAYKNLWRVLVFVHPVYQKNNICLSEAIDEFLDAIFEKTINIRHYIQVIKEACWFHYIPAHNRAAAKKYVESYLSDISKINWKNFDNAKYTAEDSLNPDEHADRAILLDILNRVPNDNGGWITDVKKKFRNAGSLSQTIEKRLGVPVDSSLGRSRENYFAVLQSIADSIIGKSPLFDHD